MKAKRRNWLTKKEDKLNFLIKRKGNAHFTETILIWGITVGETPSEPKSLIKPLRFVAAFKKLCDNAHRARLWVTSVHVKQGGKPRTVFSLGI